MVSLLIARPIRDKDHLLENNFFKRKSFCCQLCQTVTQVLSVFLLLFPVLPVWIPTLTTSATLKQCFCFGLYQRQWTVQTQPEVATRRWSRAATQEYLWLWRVSLWTLSSFSSWLGLFTKERCFFSFLSVAFSLVPPFFFSIIISCVSLLRAHGHNPVSLKCWNTFCSEPCAQLNNTKKKPNLFWTCIHDWQKHSAKLCRFWH